MSYRCLYDCVLDLERHGQLVRIEDEVDPYLEAAEIHRQVFEQRGPAIFFANLKGTKFPAVSNLFGTNERTQFIFRKSIPHAQALITAKSRPFEILTSPKKIWSALQGALHAIPIKIPNAMAPVLRHQIQVSDLPKIVSWPKDGGPFVTLPQVYTDEPSNKSSLFRSNLGMYRVQLSGNQYRDNQQIGLHYQIHRGIGVHHAKAIARKEKLKVCIFVGGPPAHTFAAIMPLPEGLPEILFAGVLAGRNVRWTRYKQFGIAAESDFCIVGTIEPHATLPEGPFGDHLGYYSLIHDFPFLQVEAVFHRKNAVWPFTVVGRPPQEDSSFGALVHKLTDNAVTSVLPGVKSLHAVDVAGVHPLLLAVGSERYTPYTQKRFPQEILTQANAILGFGQCSLAKYLLIAAEEDSPKIKNIPEFFKHVLSRIDFRRDLHFQTQTTIDTLDYSGTGFHTGSKLIMAAAGDPVRHLKSSSPKLEHLPNQWNKCFCILDGIILIQGPTFSSQEKASAEMNQLCQNLEKEDLSGFALCVIVDHLEFASKNFDTFLWVCFTRSNPSNDVYGLKSFTEFKHWGCENMMIIDARIKPHHAPPLEADPDVVKRAQEKMAKIFASPRGR